MITAERYHDFCAGHRVYGHENKCAHIHGHNYRVHFKVQGEKDKVGRVLDFSMIKEKLCNWLENTWDHKFLVWAEDPLVDTLLQVDKEGTWVVPFNPTAENMAEYLVEKIGPMNLAGTGCTLIEVKIEETRKCSATYTLKNDR